MPKDIRIIFPSSPCEDSVLQKSVQSLEQAGFKVNYRLSKPNSSFPFLCSTVEERVAELTEALLSSDHAILCARGGYGASDLLPHLPWGKLRTVRPKWLVGFSDISALQSAFFAKMGWPSIHGPMPGTDLWGKNGSDDIALLLHHLSGAKNLEGKIRVSSVRSSSLKTAEAWLFGGCMSVLCNLIGTPYFPHSLRGALLFLEDTGEHPGRVLRMLNQLLYAKILDQASGILLGNFGDDPNLKGLPEEIAKRVSIPVYTSNDFGHLSPNFPLVIGAKVMMNRDHLHWSYGV